MSTMTDTDVRTRSFQVENMTYSNSSYRLDAFRNTLKKASLYMRRN